VSRKNILYKIFIFVRYISYIKYIFYKKYFFLQIHNALVCADVDDYEFKMWQMEIKGMYYVDNFDSNPILFSDKEVKDMPILGSWTFNDYCTLQATRYSEIKKDVAKLRDESVKRDEIMNLLLEKNNELQTRFDHLTNVMISLNNNMSNINDFVTNGAVIMNNKEHSVQKSELEMLMDESEVTNNIIQNGDTNSKKRKPNNDMMLKNDDHQESKKVSVAKKYLL